MLKHALFLLRFFLLGISLFNIPLTPNLYAGDKSRTVIDSAGRKVTVPFEIKRIACLYAFAGHAVTMLGRGDDIVAISNGLRRDSLLHEICPSIMNAMVPKSQGAINFEELLRAAPDILFLARESANNKAEMDKLERFNIPVLIVDYSDIKGQQHAVEMIGEAIGSHRKASIYTDYFEACIKRVQKAVESIPMEQRPKLYHSVNEATRTTIEEGLTSDWLKVTGAINVASSSRVNLMEGKNFVSLEQILLWDPDIILANEPSVVRDVMKNRQWSALNAVKKKRVYQMPIGISRWGHPGSIETPLAILWAAKQIYPEKFNDLDMAAETKTFYKDFFEYNLSDDLAVKILSGKLVRKPKRVNENKGEKN